MQSSTIRSTLLTALSIAVFASVAPTQAKLLTPIEGFSYAEPVPVVEYHHAAKNLFFITTDPAEMAVIDAGLAQGWSRISNRAAFMAFTEPVDAIGAGGGVVSANPVCRFFVPPASHFFSASPAECAAVGNAHPDLVLETEAAFYAWLPDMSGRCPSVMSDTGVAGLQPVYRLWNAQGETNHRYTTSVVERRMMIEIGWVAEGYGDAGVAMCVPQ
jgi:Repeat of unknown function (DUF5648)